ncbi:MAG TPA: DUF523 domain-containing protein [Desulfobulbaceae bacterium]|nr:DUF523 domain-containing protein [Desulfobulbaceae bacterium]
MALPPILVSACLVGLCSRYDGVCRPSTVCLDALRGLAWVPCCPEQLGGLPTPRLAADIDGGDGEAVLAGAARIIAKDGADVTASFLRGAEECGKIAAMLGARRAFLKARSPSCAVTGVIGVTAALLRRQGLTLDEF